jgi:hypothetical protein
MLMALILLSALPPAQAQAPSSPVPRAPDGKPDLSGIWRVLDASAAYDLEPHTATFGVPAGQGVIVDPPNRMIPYRPEALAKKEENLRNREMLDPLNKCYKPGVPRITYLPFPFQIFQMPQHVTIVYEYMHNHRTIYLNRKQHLEGLEGVFWNGDAIGRWEGDTLVVDVALFNDQTWFDKAGNHHSDALHVTERYTRTDADTMTYEATIEDPNVFTRPWTIRMLLYRHKEPNFRLLEYECHAYAEDLAKQK